MDEIFTKRVRAAAIAGWWTVLIAYAILLIQWVAYLLIMARQPGVVLCLVGEGITWPELRTIWLWTMAAYKLCIAMLIFVIIWLTLWAKKLAKK